MGGGLNLKKITRRYSKVDCSNSSGLLRDIVICD